MTIENTTRSVRTQGNDATTVFDYDFLIPTGTLVVILYDADAETYTELAASEYSVTGLDNVNGGTVTYPLTGTPITPTQYLIIRRDVPYTQPLDIANQGGFFADTVMEQLDRTAMMTQQLAEVQARSLITIEGDEFSRPMPIKSALAGNTLAFDANGEPTTGPSVGEVSAAGTYAQQAIDAAAAASDSATAAAASAASVDISLANVTAATKADAEAITPDTAPDFIRTAGYSSAGDGGGALYKKVAAEPAHEGKFSITLSDGVTVVWYELAEKELLPQMFGAVADGVTPADTAFQAIAAAIQSGSFTTMRVVGTFLLTSATPFDINGAPNGVAILGVDKNLSKIIEGPGTSSYAFIIRNCDNVRVADIHFQNTATAVPGCALALKNVNNFIVERNRVTDANWYGILVSEDGATKGTCNNAVVRFNEIENIGCIGLEIFPKVLSDRELIYGNTIKKCGNNPNGYVSSLCPMKCGQGYEFAKVWGNLIIGGADVNNNTTGVSVGGGKVTHFHDNTIIDIPTYAVATTISSHPAFPDLTTDYLLIKDNLIAYYDKQLNSASQVAFNMNGDLNDNGPIIYEGNVVSNGSVFFNYDGTAVMSNVTIRNNYAESLFGQLFIAGDGGLLNPSITDNEFVSRNMSFTSSATSFTNCGGIEFVRNIVRNAGLVAVSISNSTAAHRFEDNIIDGYNVAGGSTLGAFHFLEPTAITHRVTGNRLRPGNGTPVGLVSATTSTPIIYAVDNRIENTSVPIGIGGTNITGISATAPTYVNSWINVGGSDRPGGYYKDPEGVVHLEGAVTGGTAVQIFTLPAGYRPTKNVRFAVSANSAFGQVTVDTGGGVYLTLGTKTNVYLDGISFRAA